MGGKSLVQETMLYITYEKNHKSKGHRIKMFLESLFQGHNLCPRLTLLCMHSAIYIKGQFLNKNYAIKSILLDHHAFL